MSFWIKCCETQFHLLCSESLMHSLEKLVNSFHQLHSDLVFQPSSFLVCYHSTPISYIEIVYLLQARMCTCTHTHTLNKVSALGLIVDRWP